MLPHNFDARVATKFCKHAEHCQADLLGKHVPGEVVLRERFHIDNANLQNMRHQNVVKEFVLRTCGNSETVPSQANSYQSACARRPLQTVHVRQAADSVD